MLTYTFTDFYDANKNKILDLCFKKRNQMC